MSDINVGQIAEALNDKTDRDLMNVDTGNGADAVVEYQMPSLSNNYTWYRKYASGWVEQGGYIATSSDVERTIVLPITMDDVYYNINIQREYVSAPGTTTINQNSYSVWGVMTTQFKCWDKYGTSVGIRWQVSGIAA